MICDFILMFSLRGNSLTSLKPQIRPPSFSMGQFSTGPDPIASVLHSTVCPCCFRHSTSAWLPAENHRFFAQGVRVDKKKHHGDVTCHPRENSQLAPWKIGSWKMIPFLWGSAWFFRGYSLVLEEIRWTLCIYYVYNMHILKLSLPYVKKSNQTKKTCSYT